MGEFSGREGGVDAILSTALGGLYMPGGQWQTRRELNRAWPFAHHCNRAHFTASKSHGCAKLNVAGTYVHSRLGQSSHVVETPKTVRNAVALLESVLSEIQSEIQSRSDAQRGFDCGVNGLLPMSATLSPMSSSL